MFCVTTKFIFSSDIPTARKGGVKIAKKKYSKGIQDKNLPRRFSKKNVNLQLYEKKKMREKIEPVKYAPAPRLLMVDTLHTLGNFLYNSCLLQFGPC